MGAESPTVSPSRSNADGNPSLAAEGGLEQFISEHYWGYSRRRDGRSLEYHVAHEPWRIWRASNAAFEGDGAALYGSDLGGVVARPPRSAFIADGSAVLVYAARRIGLSRTDQKQSQKNFHAHLC